MKRRAAEKRILKVADVIEYSSSFDMMNVMTCITGFCHKMYPNIGTRSVLGLSKRNTTAYDNVATPVFETAHWTAFCGERGHITNARAAAFLRLFAKTRNSRSWLDIPE